MSADFSGDLSNFSLLELFRVEVETQCAILTEGLLALERDAGTVDHLETLMRAAHSLKGAARIMNLNRAVQVAHTMEDCFVEAQRGSLALPRTRIDLLLQGVDLLTRISQTEEASMESWETEHQAEIELFLKNLSARGSSAGEATAVLPNVEAACPEENFAEPVNVPSRSVNTPPEPSPSDGTVFLPKAAIETAKANEAAPARPSSRTPDAKENQDRVLRVTADNLNRLLALAGESLVESRSLLPFAESLLRLKRRHYELAKSLENLRGALVEKNLDESTATHLHEAQQKALECRQFLADRQTELELFVRRSGNLSHRLYREALASRMRPFADGIHGFPRLVRDLAHSLGKGIKLDIVGEATQVDRDILDKIEAPLTHLIRNAADHGIETPEARQRAGKAGEGTLRLEARHSAGMLMIVVSDDGRGIDLAALRQAIVRKKLSTAELAEKLSQDELLEFLFLPGFSMKDTVTEISGRGVGLDVVQSMVKKVHGTVRISSEFGRGTSFQLLLPLTLSVMRTLLAEIDGEAYAFPLARIRRTLKLPRGKIKSLEGRQHFIDGEQLIGLVTAHQVLDLPETSAPDEELAVIILGDRNNRYGVVVERFLGERELVVQALDSRLGKLKDINASALMPDGSPVLIIDVEDFVRSIEKLASGGRVTKVRAGEREEAKKQRKRILVVDDSLTVRELERKLLHGRGYEVEVAVDGMDGWNAIRTNHYDLIISDVDMPRMDGIELVGLIKKDTRLKSLPVMIVSYKDREEDKRRGLEAGADYYLTKGSFHDETLLQAVADLVGEAA